MFNFKGNDTAVYISEGKSVVVKFNETLFVYLDNTFTDTITNVENIFGSYYAD